MSETAGEFTPKSELPLSFEFSVPPELRARFKTGELRDEWFARYRNIFDEDCYRITERQLGNHFNEWCAATQLYERYRWLSVGEGYEFVTRHPSKQHIVREVLRNHETLAAFVLSGPHGRRKREPDLRGHCPDMLCYAPDFSDWFFCEAKKLRERRYPNQRVLFPRLEELGNQPIRFATITYG